MKNNTKLKIFYNPYSVCSLNKPDRLIEFHINDIIREYKQNINRIHEYNVGNELYIYRFRLAVKNKTISVNDIELYYYNNGNTRPYKIELDENGRILNGNEYPITEWDDVISSLL